ncbi:MAG: STAS domain-containing protein [Candidatus Kapabacteria bacterium]|nr:STAS domain-containing protein [Candidatus Kapabacteria bacterium]
MRYTLENRDNIVIFTINNDNIVGEVASEIKAELLIICQPDIDALIIDLNNVLSIDSAGLGSLLLAHRQLKEHNIPIYLVGVTELVRTLMSISQIDSLFAFYTTVDEVFNDMEDEDIDN